MRPGNTNLTLPPPHPSGLLCIDSLGRVRTLSVNRSDETSGEWLAILFYLSCILLSAANTEGLASLGVPPDVAARFGHRFVNYHFWCEPTSHRPTRTYIAQAQPYIAQAQPHKHKKPILQLPTHRWLAQPTGRMHLESDSRVASMDSVPVSFHSLNFDRLKKQSVQMAAYLLHAFMFINKLFLRFVVAPVRLHIDCASDVKLLTGTATHPTFGPLTSGLTN